MTDPLAFRIELLMENFFSDHKSKAFICINSRWETVQQLQSHIESLFGIRKIILTTGDGIYLPARENIRVVQLGDVISVLPANDEHSSPDNSRSLAARNNFTEVSETALNMDTADDLETVVLDAPPKLKRVRHRKKKNTNSSDNGSNMLSSTTAEVKTNPMPKANGNFLKKNFDSKTNKHVRFGDSSSSSDSESESESELDEEIALPKKARVITTNVTREINLNISPMDGTTSTIDDTDDTLIGHENVIANVNGNGKLNGNECTEDHNNEHESAMEHLAKNLESSGKYKELIEDAKPNDIIAFKVFTPDFQKSDYVIGLVESIDKRGNNPNDYDLVLNIMAGSSHIEHLRCFDDGDDQEGVNDQNIQIGINRMDMFDGKIVEL